MFRPLALSLAFATALIAQSSERGRPSAGQELGVAAPADVDPAYFGSCTLIRSDSSGNPEKLDGVLGVLGDRVIFTARDQTVFDAPYAEIEGLLYERTKKPRYTLGLLVSWPLLFTTEKQHYLTITSRGSHAFLKLHRKNYFFALGAIESRSGMDIERIRN